MRATMLDVMSQDYMRTARAKGLKSSTVLIRHGLRNGLIPVVTLLGLEVPALFAGAVVIEQIFHIPGLGTFIYDAINKRDIIVAMSLDMFISSIVLISNLGVDLTYGWIDPRLGGPPIEAEVEVLRLSDGRYVHEGPYAKGMAASFGPSALRSMAFTSATKKIA